MKWLYTHIIIISVFLAAMFIMPVNAALQAAGPISLVNGFPVWYQDTTGLAIQPCLGLNPDGNGLADPNCGVLGDAIFDPLIPVSFPTNFPGEFFYYIADADTPKVGPAQVTIAFRYALEGSFTAAPAAGSQIVFLRTNLRISQVGGTNGLVANSVYNITHPFGIITCNTDLNGDIATCTDANGNGGGGAQPYRVEDGAFVPPLTAITAASFLAAPNTGFGPFLKAVNPVPPIGYIGNPAIPQTIQPGPNGDFFRMTGSNIDPLNADGLGDVNSLTSNLWFVAGKIAVIDAVPPVNGTITGTVTNATSGAALSGATVTAGSMTVTTNETGGYNMSIVPGTYFVNASKAGFTSSPVIVTVASGATVAQNFALQPMLIVIGDVTGDGGTNIVDSLFIDQATVGLRTLTPAQLVVADVSRDGRVDLVDALFIAHYSVGLRLIDGAVPLISPVAANPDPVSVESITLSPGSTGTVAIKVNSVTTNTAAATVRLTFNPAFVTVTAVNQGNLGGPVSNINNALGTVNISVFTTSDVTAAPVTIANVVLQANPGAPQGADSPLTLSIQALSDSNGVNRVPGASEITSGNVTIVVSQANGTIRGTVTNATSGAALSGATVTAGSMTVTTNATGAYSMSIAPGIYAMTANAAGFVTNTTPGVIVAVGATTIRNFALQPMVIVGGTVVSITDAAAAQNGIVFLPIMVENVTNLGAGTISLSYDPDVVQVISVSEGDLGVPIANINNIKGNTLISAFSAISRSGNVAFANVQFRASGPVNSTSPLILSVIILADQNGTLFPNTTRSGTFKVSGLVTGDVTGDGGTNIVDSLFIGQFTVGLRTLTPLQLVAGDVNGDSTVNIVDALFIAQYSVGLRLIDGAVPLISPIAANPDPVSAGSLILSPGGIGMVPIRVNSVTTDIAAATVRLTFNPAVVNVIAVNQADLTTLFVQNINNAAGTVDISAVSVTGVTAAPVTIANVVLQANPGVPQGTTSPLTLSVQALSDSNGVNRVPGPSGITNGNVVIAPPAVATVIRIANHTAMPGSRITVPVWLDNGSNVAGGSFKVIFNSRIARVTNVGSVDFGTVTSNIDNANGSVFVAVAQPGAVGRSTAILANITFTVPADIPMGTNTVLSLGQTDLNDENGSFVAHSSVNGLLRIEGVRGDVNRNERRDKEDAALILKYIVGLPIPQKFLPILPAGDMNCNNRIDTGDATLILRDLEGLPIPKCWM